MNLVADFGVWGIAAVVSFLEVGVALIPYHVGKHGFEAVLARFPQMKQERLKQVQALYRERGPGMLFFSFVPILGTLLAAGAGIVSMQLSTFVLWVLLGRAARNSVLALLITQGILALGVR